MSTRVAIREHSTMGAKAAHEARTRSAARWVYACRVADIVPDTGCGVLIGSYQLAVFRLRDPHTGRERIHALDNVDPFSGAAVLSRGLVGDAGGDVYVASPMYKQRFSLASGYCLDDPAVHVRVHEVRIADGWILVARPDAGDVAARAAEQPAPAGGE